MDGRTLSLNYSSAKPFALPPKPAYILDGVRKGAAYGKKGEHLKKVGICLYSTASI